MPMTKLRRWAHPDDPKMIHPESWVEAAVRNVAENLGRTLTDEPNLLLKISDYLQSDRDQVVKHYRFHVFGICVDDKSALVPGAVGQWLSPADFLDQKRRPISPTARFLVDSLKNEGKL